MGNKCPVTPKVDEELYTICSDAAYTLRRVAEPEQLLFLALEDHQLYDVCKINEDLRLNCIIAAIRRYHRERLFYKEVHERTADFMKLLDAFTIVQDEADRRRYNPTWRERMEDLLKRFQTPRVIMQAPSILPDPNTMEEINAETETESDYENETEMDYSSETEEES